MMSITFTFNATWSETDGSWIASWSSNESQEPGFIATEGKTMEELKSMVGDAIRHHLKATSSDINDFNVEIIVE